VEQRKVSIAIGAGFASAPVPGQRDGSIGASMRQSMGEIPLGGQRKLTAVHRPSNAYDFFSQTPAGRQSVSVGGGVDGRKSSTYHRSSMAVNPGSSLVDAVLPDVPAFSEVVHSDQSIAPPQEPFVEMRRLSLGTAPVNVFGFRRGSVVPSANQIDGEASNPRDEEAGVGGTAPARKFSFGESPLNLFSFRRPSAHSASHETPENGLATQATNTVGKNPHIPGGGPRPQSMVVPSGGIQTVLEEVQEEEEEEERPRILANSHTQEMV
jgi:hypothetical protein